MTQQQVIFHRYVPEPEEQVRRQSSAFPSVTTRRRCWLRAESPLHSKSEASGEPSTASVLFKGVFQTAGLPVSLTSCVSGCLHLLFPVCFLSPVSSHCYLSSLRPCQCVLASLLVVLCDAHFSTCRTLLLLFPQLSLLGE